MKTICPNNFDYVDAQFPCERSFCSCHKNYKNYLELTRKQRIAIKKEQNAARQSA